MREKRAEQLVPLRATASEPRQRLAHSIASRQIAGPLTQKTKRKLLRIATISAHDWHQEILLSTLFRACIKLQTQMDRRFRKARMTAQEAAVLVRCVDSRRSSPGALANAMDRDKGKVTRFIQRLVTRGLLKREVSSQDRRVAHLKPTSRGRAMVPQLRLIFNEIREQLFQGTSAKDIERVGNLLLIMLTNVDRNGLQSENKRSRRKGYLDRSA
jgi:DNA-binding MarR family transcriptional regulator